MDQTAATPTATVATTTEIPIPPKEKYLKDYKPSPYRIDNVELYFALDEEGLATRVKSTLHLRKLDSAQDLTLDATNFKLLNISVNGNALSDGQYTFEPLKGYLTIHSVPDGKFTVESEVELKPAENKAYEGLYMSSENYCTQCEAEGFRNICPFLDRPDIMAQYVTTIEAPKHRFPILLSNGNCVETKELDNGRHIAKYVDPWPKPSYLFALVAGNLVSLEDKFVTMSGKNVTLRIYVRKEDLDKTPHSMESLKKAMKWDETTYGREYDLDIFNIVAVPDFNMGAMENKSLNIFNTSCVLASKATSTDSDFNAIAGVVAHEYFHNWTGNRVTCRDWFQLSLKEGLTVFRDQSFSQDTTSAAVKRIKDVFLLRSTQFAEDASPMAHPVRPASYITCNNFYTTTVYKKGAEVIRMLHTILGEKGYRAGTDLYFERYDGQAVTCDDWVQTLQDANPGTDLTHFKLWYSQAGTPVVTVLRKWEDGNLYLTFEQKVPDTRGQRGKKPMHIPIKIGLVDPQGHSVKVDIGDSSLSETKTIQIRKEREQVVVRNVGEGTLPSLLRDFSAPVKLIVDPPFSSQELGLLMSKDPNPFARWEAGQKLMLDTLMQCYKSSSQSFSPVSESLTSALSTILKSSSKSDKMMTALLLTLPTESFMIGEVNQADPQRIRAARIHVRKSIASALNSEFSEVYAACAPDSEKTSLDMSSQGNRALRNAALSYLVLAEGDHWHNVALKQVREATNMTAEMGALGALSQVRCSQRDTALSEFYEKWKSDGLVMDKWLAVQATAATPDVLRDVERLAKHEVFDLNNPNKCYSLLRGFASMNMHMDESGAGYKFIADKVLLLDSQNPQVAARIVRAFARLHKFDSARQDLMRKECERIKSAGVSRDVYEVVAKTLDS